MHTNPTRRSQTAKEETGGEDTVSRRPYHQIVARLKKNMPRYLMLGPALLLAALLIVFPVAYAVYLSVSDWSPTGVKDTFVGLSNFERLLQDGLFWNALRVTLTLYFVSLIVETVLGTYLAFLLNREVPGNKIFRALILIPSITAPVAISMMWLLLYDPTLGMANYLLRLAGFTGLEWLGDPGLVVYSLAIVDIWEWTPFMGLIILAGLKDLPADPLEAADIDGATPLQKLWHVYLPLLRPIILVAILLRSVDLLRFFDTIYVMTQGGPVNASTTLNIFAYRQGFQYFDLSYASTAMLALLVVVAIIASCIMILRRRFSYEV